MADVKDILDKLYLSNLYGGNEGDVTSMGGRLGYAQPINTTSGLDVGISGHAVKGPGFSDAKLDQVDATYRKRFDNDSELRAKLRKNIGNSRGEEYIGAEYEIPFKKGGKVKAKPKTSKASKRGDGCCRKGKTKGRMV